MLFLAAGLGLEPRYSAPKADVLPLDDPAIIQVGFLLFYYRASLFTSRQACPPQEGLPADRQACPPQEGLPAGRQGYIKH